MMATLSNHGRAEIAHAVRRGEERHGLTLPEIVEIKQKIRTPGGSIPVERRCRRTCVHEVEHRGSHLYVVYDRRTHEIVTFLPTGWTPAHPFPWWGPPGKKKAFGGVVIHGERLLLRKVTGSYKGYVWTFPKGRADEDETREQTALREVREETGHECEITGFIQQPFRGIDTETVYFFMRSVQDHGDYHDETCDVRWVHLDEAEYLLGLTEHKVGRERDLAVLHVARKRVRCR